MHGRIYEDKNHHSRTLDEAKDMIEGGWISKELFEQVCEERDGLQTKIDVMRELLVQADVSLNNMLYIEKDETWAPRENVRTKARRDQQKINIFLYGDYALHAEEK